MPILIIAKASLSAQLSKCNGGKNGKKIPQSVGNFFVTL
jgi:hypothetical protein